METLEILWDEAIAEDKQLITKTEAKTRYRLTESMFRQIGKADVECKNPYYACAAPMKLYRCKRLESWMEKNKETIAKTLARREKLSSTLLARAKEKRNLTFSFAKELHLYTLPPFDKIWARSLKHAERLQGGCLVSPPGLNGIVATIRHDWSNYDSICVQLNGRVGGCDAYADMRERIDEKILAWLEVTRPEMKPEILVYRATIK